MCSSITPLVSCHVFSVFPRHLFSLCLQHIGYGGHLSLALFSLSQLIRSLYVFSFSRGFPASCVSQVYWVPWSPYLLTRVLNLFWFVLRNLFALYCQPFPPWDPKQGPTAASSSQLGPTFSSHLLHDMGALFIIIGRLYYCQLDFFLFVPAVFKSFYGGGFFFSCLFLYPTLYFCSFSLSLPPDFGRTKSK